MHTHTQDRHILETVVDRYGLVDIIDKNGVQMGSAKEAQFFQTGYFVLRYNVSIVIKELRLPYPPESRIMLKAYLPIIDEQCEEIHHLLEKSQTSKALRRLRLRENTLWALTNFEEVTHPEVMYMRVFVCVYVYVCIGVCVFWHFGDSDSGRRLCGR